MWFKHYIQEVLTCNNCPLGGTRNSGEKKKKFCFVCLFLITGRRSREKSKIWGAVRKQPEVKEGCDQGLGENETQK